MQLTDKGGVLRGGWQSTAVAFALLTQTARVQIQCSQEFFSEFLNVAELIDNALLRVRVRVDSA